VARGPRLTAAVLVVFLFANTTDTEDVLGIVNKFGAILRADVNGAGRTAACVDITRPRGGVAIVGLAQRCCVWHHHASRADVTFFTGLPFQAALGNVILCTHRPQAQKVGHVDGSVDVCFERALVIGAVCSLVATHVHVHTVVRLIACRIYAVGLAGIQNENMRLFWTSVVLTSGSLSATSVKVIGDTTLVGCTKVGRKSGVVQVCFWLTVKVQAALHPQLAARLEVD
jgi:hypothetical protein